ncbi:dimethylarginine dimethylaminohydrolase family protein [Undibacterium arcticum]|uniref:arginine deiminase n=1 Tax=Undibacterium arcticum TaxID=1762892 RepID=A0ABV7F2T3_9BURK
MQRQATILITEPSHFNVSYAINPWMKPESWAADPVAAHRSAMAASAALQQALQQAGCVVEVAPGTAGLPDMVFPANSAVVLDGRAITSRFRHPQRRGEEDAFLRMFDGLRERGLLREVRQLPPGVFQEGAGDCMWDEARGHFWAGFGPRSSHAAIALMAEFFGREIVPLELVSERCYHLDVCFVPLSGGEILYFPPALTEAALQTLRSRVPADQLIEATEDDLRNFSINAVNVGRHIVLSNSSQRLRAVLEQRGYTLIEVDLSPFMLSGGGAYCMTLRLDRSSSRSSSAEHAATATPTATPARLAA